MTRDSGAASTDGAFEQFLGLLLVVWVGGVALLLVGQRRPSTLT